MKTMDKMIYSTTVINKGGREGDVTLLDGTPLYDIAMPGTKLENGLTDPERLFAAAYSSCFNQALTVAKGKMGIEASTDVETTVDLYELEDGTFTIGVKLTVTVSDVSKTNAEFMVNYAEQICPYSRALRNNVKVAINIESQNIESLVNDMFLALFLYVTYYSSRFFIYFEDHSYCCLSTKRRSTFFRSIYFPFFFA